MTKKKQSKKIGGEKSMSFKDRKETKTKDYTPDKWLKSRKSGIEQEFKKYSPDLNLNSGKSAEECAITAMTLAHHGTEKSIKVLKEFKKDPRAPMWIDCAIEECEMIHWEDTVGKRLDKATENLKAAAGKVMEEKLIFSKEIITGALREIFKKQGTAFTYGEKVELYADKKVIAEDNAEFIIDDVLLVSIKPGFAEWIMLFKEGKEGKDLRKGDLENIEQGIWYNDDGEKLDALRALKESFDDFYSRQFYNLLQMSKKTMGILLDFSGSKVYGKYFSAQLKNGVEAHSCSGWCEGCFEELKCDTAQEFKEEEDKRKYRILKKLMKQIVETEERIKSTEQPIADLKYEIEIVEKLRDESEKKLENAKENKKDKNKEEIKRLEERADRWCLEIDALSALASFECPKQEDADDLKILREKYDAIKGELQTEEYKKDTEGLEVYYGKAEPTGDACYHDPLCECDQYGEVDAEDEIWDDVEADLPF